MTITDTPLHLKRSPITQVIQQDALRQVTYTTICIQTEKPIKHESYHLRGFFSQKYPEYDLLHNHEPSGKKIFRYPLVQYKILGEKAYLVGINRGARLVPLLTEELHQLELGDTKYTINQIKIVKKRELLGLTNKPQYYQFITPWLGLNTKNYELFAQMNSWRERKGLLNRIIIGNCLSLAKGLGIVVPKRLYAHSHLDRVEVLYKNIPMKGFVGQFKINFQLSELIGIGKGVSRGHGTVMRMPSKQISSSK